MPPRKSDASSTTASAARFAPIEDDPPNASSPALALPMQQQQPHLPGAAPPGHATSALALPSMDTSMPPPSLPPPTLPPPPGAASAADAVVFRPSTAAASTPTVAAGSSASPAQAGGEKGKEKEEGKTGPGGHPKEAITIPIEELQLPRSIITRLAKGVLPPNTQIQANAILAMTKSATVFINHLANAANEVTTLQSKRTIMPADVFRALDDIEFGFMRERVEAEFNKFNETQTTKRSAYRKKIAAAKKGPKDGSAADTDGDTTMGGADADASAVDSPAAGGASGGQPRAKKARTDGEAVEEEDASDPEDVPIEDDDEEEEEPVDEEEDEDEEGGGGEEEERDELEEREERADEDEALDDGNQSD